MVFHMRNVSILNRKAVSEKVWDAALKFLQTNDVAIKVKRGTRAYRVGEIRRVKPGRDEILVDIAFNSDMVLKMTGDPDEGNFEIKHLEWTP